jgi:hypothetical protein
MARRAAYTRVEKHNQVRPAHVRRMGDVVFKGFKCLNPECHRFLFVREEQISEYFEITCDVCGYLHKYGDETKFYDYDLRSLADNGIIETGAFAILHDDYIAEAGRYKYCIICATLKPLEFFDRHSARKSGRQGECNLCKQVYNSVKNQTRTTDQHREAAQKRRLYVDLAGSGKIDSKAIYERYGFCCFACGKDLSADLQAEATAREGNLDHTLPAIFLWPLTTDNATLLCRDHNAEKAEKWPGEYYTGPKLRELVVKTGIDYDTFADKPHYNPVALERLHDEAFVESLLHKYAAYIDEIIRLRNRILVATGFDFFQSYPRISQDWVKKADAARRGG